MALLKITNCTLFTGGGKRKDAIPKRLRHNVNIRMSAPDSWIDLPPLTLKYNLQRLRNFSFLTTPNSKVVWNPTSNYKIKHKRLEKKKINSQKSLELTKIISTFVEDK